MLVIDKLKVAIKNSDKVVIDDFSLTIPSGQIHAIMGPNGTGKSTLAKTIMGHYKFEILSGSIDYNGEIINDLEPNERSHKGIFLAMQDPTELDGVTGSEFLKTALNAVSKEKISLFDFIKQTDKAMEELSLDPNTLHRYVNKGFSGGEKKKNEVLQMKILKPSLIILDEIDSGLDVDSLKIVCANINSYLKENKDTSVLIITHYPRILEYIKPDYVHIMQDGNIKLTGDFNLAKNIEKDGYSSINVMK